MFLATMLTVSALFIWFEGFSHIDGEKFADQLIDTACSMGPDADYHIEVVDHEILGVDLSAKEWECQAKFCRISIILPVYAALYFDRARLCAGTAWLGKNKD